jgi:hypothetical protein
MTTWAESGRLMTMLVIGVVLGAVGTWAGIMSVLDGWEKDKD